MSQFHKPRETDYYLRVPTELVVFQEPVFPWRDKNLLEKKKKEKDRERRERERKEGEAQGGSGAGAGGTRWQRCSAAGAAPALPAQRLRLRSCPLRGGKTEPAAPTQALVRWAATLVLLWKPAVGQPRFHCSANLIRSCEDLALAGAEQSSFPPAFGSMPWGRDVALGHPWSLQGSGDVPPSSCRATSWKPHTHMHKLPKAKQNRKNSPQTRIVVTSTS